MAFLRFSRDKRGYEHFYLVEATKNRRGKTRARVLYWFRTPPSVKVGREPFDPELRRAIEAQNPGVTFDWRKIVETPIPSADAEKWRERRRVERAERAARRPPVSQAATAVIPESIDEAPDDQEPDDDQPPGEMLDVSIDAAERQADALEPTEESLVADAASIETPASPASAVNPESSSQHRRRRRRRRRRPQSAQPNAADEHRESVEQQEPELSDPGEPEGE